MGALNIAGGLAQGYVRGDQDNQRRREFESMQRQRDRLEREQALDDSLAKELRGIRPEGEYTDYVPQGHEAASDFMGPVGPPSGAKGVKTKRSASDVAREQAGVYTRTGARLKDLQAGAVLRQQALQLQEGERKERYAQGSEALLQAEAMLDFDPNPENSWRHLQEKYKGVLDGHELKEELKDGVKLHGIVDPQGRWLEPPQPMNKQSVKALIDRGWNYISPESRAAERTFGIEDRRTKATEAAAQAASLNAESNYQKALFEAGPDAQKARQALIDFHNEQNRIAAIRANAELRRANAEGGAKFGPTKEAYDKDGNLILLSQVRNKDGSVSWQQDTLPPGTRLAKKPLELNDIQKDSLKTFRELEKEGYFLNKDTKEPNPIKRAQWLRDNGLGVLLEHENDAKATASIAANLPKKDQPAAAAPAATPAATSTGQIPGVDKALGATNPIKARNEAKVAAIKAEKDAAMAKSVAEFSADLKSMQPLELSRKWTMRRGELPAAQLQEYNKAIGFK